MVVRITDDGDLVTDITGQQLETVPRDESVSVRCDEHETLGIFSTDHDQPDATFVAVLAADGLLRLAIVGVSAADMLGIRVGEKVIVTW